MMLCQLCSAPTDRKIHDWPICDVCAGQGKHLSRHPGNMHRVSRYSSRVHAALARLDVLDLQLVADFAALLLTKYEGE